MAPGGGVCKEVFESRPTFANYDIIKPKVEKNSTPVKSVIVAGEKHGMPLSNRVHELLVHLLKFNVSSYSPGLFMVPILLLFVSELK